MNQRLYTPHHGTVWTQTGKGCVGPRDHLLLNMAKPQSHRPTLPRHGCPGDTGINGIGFQGWERGVSMDLPVTVATQVFHKGTFRNCVLGPLESMIPACLKGSLTPGRKQ